MWKQVFLLVLAAFLFGCGSEAAVASQLERKESSNSSPPGTIKCEKPGFKLFVKSAEFSPASEKFCSRLCRRVPAENSIEECIPTQYNFEKGCKRRFPAEDVWMVYKKCQNLISEGKPCYLDQMEGLSQPKGADIQYYCVNEKSTKDPCSVKTTGETRDLYHDLSSQTQHRRCLCTGKVSFRETEWDVKLVPVRYLHFLDPTIYSDRPMEMSSAILTSNAGEEAMDVSARTNLVMASVNRTSPTFAITVQIPKSHHLSGFLWIHFRDDNVNINCRTYSGSIEVSVRPDGRTTVSTSTATDVEWLPLYVVGAAVFIIAVIVAVVVLVCVMKKSRSSPTINTPTPSSSQPTTPTEEHSSTHLLNSVYTEVNPHRHNHQHPNNSFTSNHHDYHPPTHTHRSSPPNYEDPLLHTASSSSATPGADYATLQRHQGDRVVVHDSGNADTYDHTLMCADPYQALERGARRQPVIDNVYDSTER